MTFLNPLVLFGLIAGAIPIILHLLNLRRMKTVEFSTVMFLKEIQKTKIRKLKLKQILLLILRTLLIILIVLAFSRPAIEGTIPGFENFANTSAVIIVDNSYSMDVSDEWGNRFNQSKTAVRQIINGLKEGDEAVILSMADKSPNRRVNFTRNLNLIMDDLNNIKISSGTADLYSTLTIASRLIQESGHINKEVYIISDFQSNVFRRDEKDTSKIFDEKVSLNLIPIGNSSKSLIQNYSVDSVNVLSKIFHTGKLVELELNIKNHTQRDAKGIIAGMILNKVRTSQRSVDIPAGKTKQVPIAAEPTNKGVYSGAIELENDALDYDNKRYFAFYIPENPKVLLAGSDEARKYAAIVFGGDSLNGFAQLKETDAQQISGVDFTNYDVIVLTSGNYRKSDLDRLSQHIRNGGNALLFANDAESYDVYWDFLNEIGFGKPAVKQFNKNQPASFVLVDKKHPIFEGVFKETSDKRAVIESPKIYKCFPVSMGLPIIEVPGGAGLSEIRAGSGKLLYFGLTADYNWSNLPSTGIFPTLVYRSVMYLALGDDISVNAVVGEQLNLSIPKQYSASGSFKIIDPNGTEFFKQSVLLPKGHVLSFEELNTPGTYQVYTPNSKLVSLISVNPEASESNLNALSNQKIESDLKGNTGELTRIEIFEDTSNILQTINRVRLGTELWKFLLMAALLCAVAEMIVQKSTKVEQQGN